MLRLIPTSLAAFALAACATVAQPPSTAASDASQAAVAAADPRAQAAGEAMLAAGGNATDAAIATMLALTVVEPQSSGIGGGGLFVRGTADGAVATVDGRETAPEAAGPEWFYVDGKLPNFDESVRSGLSVGVPGNVALAARAHEQYGKLPWAQLFAPAIALARDGFVMNVRLHDALGRNPTLAGWSDAGKALFYEADGAPRAVGTRVVNEPLARTFEAIAAQGPEAFYRGALAREIATTVAAHTPRPAAMTTADIAGYDAKDRDAVCGSYRGYRVCSMGPPTSGGIAVLQMLGLVEQFDLRALGADNPVTWHLFIEAQRLAYADRELYLADSDFVSVPVAGLIDRQYLAERSKLIDPARSLGLVTAGTPAGAPLARADGDEPEEHGTSHIAATDEDGTMVSYTSTIESAFGSGLIAGGFYLNNELTDFSRNPVAGGREVANRVEGGKRPRSSMSPTVIWDPQGRPFFVVGAAGGATIPVTTARAIIGAIDLGLSAHDALALPFLMQMGDTLMVEQGTWLERAAPALRALGHTALVARPAPIKAGAIRLGAGGAEGARDPRIDSSLDEMP